MIWTDAFCVRGVPWGGSTHLDVQADELGVAHRPALQHVAQHWVVRDCARLHPAAC
jgi:hypothetical protein